MLTKTLVVGDKTIVVRETGGGDEEAMERVIRGDKTIETPIAFGAAFSRAMTLCSIQSIDGAELQRPKNVFALRELGAGFTSRELRAVEKAFNELNGPQGEANGDGSADEDGSASASPSQPRASAGRQPKA